VQPATTSPAVTLTQDEKDLLERFRKSANKDDKATPAPMKDGSRSAPTDVARITVKLPSDARLWVDQVECPLTSEVRAFNTPALRAGNIYAYTMRIRYQRDGQAVEDQQRVLVAAGRQVNVDFTNSNGSVATAQR
jgi:uncharacterized protein (TIGR03000 family)